MQVCRVYIICLSLFAISFALEPAKAHLEPLPHLRGDEQISIVVSVPYLGGRQSPGDIIGMTWYDTQASGSFGQRIMVDDLGQAHIDWMKRDAAGANRYCAWNARFSTGSYYGETQASESWSGYVRIAITRDANPDSQRSVITYHFNPGSGYYSWVDIDAGNLWGALPNNPRSPQIADYIWPTICVANNNNFIMATGDMNQALHHLFVSTDEGINWTLIADFDSVANLSYFLRSSRNSGSNKVVFAHTRFITDTVASGQLDHNVWYMISIDGGITWGPHTNLTNYQPYPIDSVRAYCDVNAVFDYNDNLHITWTGMKIDDSTYYRVSKIFHWDEVSDTITVVNSPSVHYPEPGGWWIGGTLGQFPAWKLPADQPQCVVDINEDLYCLWHGNDDTTDVSAAGYFNGELYGSYSADNGITWLDYVNLTNTRSPGACDAETYMTAHPCVYNDSIWITYIEDKDAGDAGHAQGVYTENPVRCWIFPTSLITGIKEDQASISKFQEPILRIEPNPFTTHCVVKLQAPKSKSQVVLNIFDASGRLIKDFFLPTAYSLVPTTIKWSGTDRFDRPVPAGVYFVELTAGDESITEKVIKLR